MTGLIPVSNADSKQLVWRHVGEWFANVNIVNMVAVGLWYVMVWAGILSIAI